MDLSHLRRQNLAITAGSSLPSGEFNATDPQGGLLDAHAQLGTGAFGPYVGVLYAFHQDPWNLTGNVSGRFHTVGTALDAAAGPQAYQFGPAVLWSLRAQFRVFDWLALIAGTDGRYAGHDFGGDAGGMTLQTNTGGLVLAAVPGVTVNLTGNL